MANNNNNNKTTPQSHSGPSMSPLGIPKFLPLCLRFACKYHAENTIYKKTPIPTEWSYYLHTAYINF